MEAEKALFAVSLLVGATGGENSWSQQTIDYYVHELSNLGDGDCLVRACQKVANTWGEAGRARLGAVHEAYKAEIVRREMTTPAISATPDRIVPLKEGVEIARVEYRKECARRGIEPDDNRFESMLARMLCRKQDLV